MFYIAADHAGHRLKKDLEQYFKNTEMEYEDLGNKTYDEKDDFVDFAVILAKKVVETGNKGILICGSGHGMCIVANKIKGIRAVVGYSISGTELGRKHNDANILCLAGRIITKDHAQAIVKTFLNTEFTGEERFVRRNQKISDLEG
ncbi:MAG: RpiB/LacA/LacB family sugar-phosphate isomerase [Candidatus Magasanikbacteria bacterium]|nr:RpiB/LacA/LacB family sugar-phosphate isomerase [Candidatus Magasanikbacteria bacterium]